MTIRVLDRDTVARIAAGEVVERPAAVVKELVENSLDSGAAHISVEARGGGISLIEVSDDGCGIPSGEIEVAFERHATSKLSSAVDLESIVTLGFRGEALPSIAAVAEVELVSSFEGREASFISLVDGKVTGNRVRARPQGTTVTVRNLFRNVPARLKFLRSTATENSHIASIVSQYALAYPGVSFSLVVDGRKILSTLGTGRLLDSVLSVYGLDLARQMIEIKREMRREDAPSSISVSGLIGAPQLARTSRDFLSFFVNRRWISGRVLSKAVEDAYHGLLMVGRHPVAIINVELPPREVDVNIHPAKTEVRFQNDAHVFGAVQRAVRNTLIDMAPVPLVQQPAATYAAPPPLLAPQAGRSRFQAWQAPVPRPPENDQAPSSPPITLPWNALPALRVLGQMGGTYILAEGPDGLYIIDQHAAHERIMFEKIERQRRERGVEVQGLLESVTFEAAPREDSLIKGHLDDLKGFGFSLEPFGGTTYVIKSAPAGLDGRGCLAALREILEAPADGASMAERIAQSLACHSAVRAGKALDIEEMRALVRELEQTAYPHTCPHGRPTMIRMALSQLEREFKRT